MSLYAERLERGRFLWPSPADGTVAITSAQLAYVGGTRVRTWRPDARGEGLQRFDSAANGERNAACRRATIGFVTASETTAALKAALAPERQARQEAESRASGAEALVAYYKLQIAKLRREQYGQSSERSRNSSSRCFTRLGLHGQAQLEAAAASAAEDEIAARGRRDDEAKSR